MKKFLPYIFMVLFLPSCFNTFGALESGLDSHQGQSLTSLINKIGYPTSQMNIAGRKLYVWHSSQTVSYSMPTTSSTSGTVYSWTSSGMYSGSSTVWVPTTANYQCKITVEVDDSDNIINNTFEGNIGGCERYAKAFR